LWIKTQFLSNRLPLVTTYDTKTLIRPVGSKRELKRTVRNRVGAVLRAHAYQHSGYYTNWRGKGEGESVGCWNPGSPAFFAVNPGT